MSWAEVKAKQAKERVKDIKAEFIDEHEAE